MSHPTPLFKEESEFAQSHVQFWERRSHSLLWQPAPVFDHPYCKNLFLYIYSDFYVFQFVLVASHSITMHLAEKSDFTFSPPFHLVLSIAVRSPHQQLSSDCTAPDLAWCPHTSSYSATNPHGGLCCPCSSMSLPVFYCWDQNWSQQFRCSLTSVEYNLNLLD